MSLARLELHGLWTRSIDNLAIDTVPVPGGYRPLGKCTLKYTFDWPDARRSEDRFFLMTEGAMASAAFSLNGHDLGVAGPFCRYRFEIPAELLLPRRNCIQAHVTDPSAAL